MREPTMRVLVLLCAAAGVAFGGAAPDQVLVLYNADWTEDLDGTEPGQDSLEVARYYVAQHTDPQTGKKPHLLGLRCAKPEARRLDQMRLPEDSEDNTLGLRRKDDGSQPKEPPWSASGIAVFDRGQMKRLDRRSLVIKVCPTEEEDDAEVAWAEGQARGGYPLEQKEHGERYLAVGVPQRCDLPDGFFAWVEAKTKEGEPLVDFHAQYFYPDGFAPDFAGPDGIRDDGNYLADIATPVKAFLEDPANRLPDGTPLRDHILYIVACYGLPKQVEASFGVARGVRGRCGRRDDGRSLEAALIVLYHDMARYHQPIVFPASRGKVHSSFIVSRLRLTLAGANPYRHPGTHSRRKKGKGLEGSRLYPSYGPQASRIPHFAAARRQLGDRFLYSATRIDARHPELAKAQVDGAIYGTRHLTPELGWFWNEGYAAADQGALELKYFGFRDRPRPQDQGRVLFYFGDFGYSTAYLEDPEKPPVPYLRGFYPGSYAAAVRSYLGWELSRRVSQLYDHNSRYPERMLEAGATVCATSAHGAHDTSGTWPDEQVLFHHLLRGYDLGEAFLMSSIYLDWLLSRIGDPLYRPDLRHTEPDATPPQVEAPIAVRLGSADGRYFARLRPRLQVSRENPEMADIAVTYWRAPDAKRTASHWRFSRRPRALLLHLEPQATYHYDVVLTDPYGNRFSSAEALGDLTFETGPPPPAKKPLLRLDYEAEPQAPTTIELAGGEGQAPPLEPERGELHVEFTPQKPDFELVAGEGRRFLLTSDQFAVGGRLVAFCSPPGGKRGPRFEPGRRYRIVARWRRHPVVRQAVLVARDGQEFQLGSNNRLAWLAEPVGSRLRVRNLHCTVHALSIYDDTHPQPLDPLYPRPFDQDGFEAADAKEAP
ncbi:MAG: hypothetical protein ACLF0G_06395 [Candidatus Brocadiia bacterium]